MRTIPFDKIGASTNLISQSFADQTILWGVAPTGPIHLGYAGYFLLLRQLRDRGAQIILLLANYHGYLDSNKAKWETLERRTRTYRTSFASVGFPDIRETKEFYCRPEYIEALLRFSSFCKLTSTLAAGKSTLKASASKAALSDVLYVATQVLDIKFLHINTVICGRDEASIYRFGIPILKKHYRWNCGRIFLPMCPGIFKNEMHSSDIINNKILLSDAPRSVHAKIAAHFSRSKALPPLFDYCHRTLFPLANREDLTEKLGALKQSKRELQIRELANGISEVLEALTVR